MSKIDVYELANQIESILVPQTQERIRDLVDSINGQHLTSGEIIEKLVSPLIGISNNANRQFTVELLQAVINRLDEQK